MRTGQVRAISRFDCGAGGDSGAGLPKLFGRRQRTARGSFPCLAKPSVRQDVIAVPDAADIVHVDVEIAGPGRGEENGDEERCGYQRVGEGGGLRDNGSHA